MDLEQYRTEANKLIDFICEYRKNVDKQRVIPSEDIKADFLLKTFTGTKIDFENRTFQYE